MLVDVNLLNNHSATGTTYTDEAIEAAKDMFENDPPRPGVARVLIVVTDGRPTG